MSHSVHLRSLTAALIASIIVLSLSSAPVSGEETTKKDPPREESVVGGKPVSNGQYRFVSALIDKSRAGNDYDRQFCGGTLIDRNSVLTAAHCVDGRTTNTLEVVVGRTVLTSSQGVSRDVSRIRIHPRFKGTEVNSTYDAAVLTLESPVNIAPIRISGPSDNSLEKPGERLFIAGWGNTVRQPPSGGAGSGFPDRMRQAKVPVVSDAKTKAAYQRPSVPPQLRFYPALMVGAGQSGRDTCQGDSGGPLFAKGERKIQVGITSYGAGCGANGYPGVYTEVNSPQIRSFIIGAA